MKNRFSKLLSLILCLSILLSMAGITASADDAAATESTESAQIENGTLTVYLDPITGTANGTGTQDSPVKTVAQAVALINAANVTEATVLVSNKNVLTPAADGTSVPTHSYPTLTNKTIHTANITYTTWDNTGTGNKAILIFYSVVANAGNNGYIAGPSEFTNIVIADQSKGNNKHLTLQGYNAVVHSDVDFYCYNGNNASPAYVKDGAVSIALASVRSALVNPTGDGAFLHLHNAGTAAGQVDTVYASSYVDKATDKNFITFPGNVAVFVEGGTLGSFNPDNTNNAKVDVETYPDCRATYEKNLSLVLNDKATVNNVKNSYGINPMIKGALQLVVNYGSTLKTVSVAPVDENGAAADVYYVYSKSADIELGVAEDGESGEFTVSGGKYAYVVSEDGSEIYYGNETLTIPAAGTYNVYAADSVDAIKESVDFPVDESKVAIGWTDDGKGTLTATYRDFMTKDYYVVYGGTGDGRTYETAAPSVDVVIEAVNKDLVVGDTARINIIDYVNKEDDSQSWNNYAGGEGAYVGKFANEGASSATSHTRLHHMTPWIIGTAYNIEAHDVKLLVTSYDYENTGVVTHLAFTPNLGQNEDMYINGPVIFENISLVNMRRDYRGVNTMGNDVTFGEGTLLQCVVSESTGTYADDNGTKFCFQNDMKLINCNQNLSLASTYGKPSGTMVGGTVRLIGYGANKSGSRGIFIPSAKSGTYTFSEREAVYIENAGINSNIYWGSMSASTTDTFNGGLAIVVNAAGSLASNRLLSSGARAYSNVVINGGYQVICNNGETFPEYPDNVTVNGGEWYMNSADTNGNTLDLTDTAGTFKVNSSLTAVATDSNGVSIASEDGLLTVEPGIYTVVYVEESALNTVYFDGELYGSYISGAEFTFPALSDTPVQTFVGWTDGTESYAAGDTLVIENSEYSFTSVWENVDGIAAVYVSETGSDDNDGLTKKAPKATINAAIDAIKDAEEESKYICVSGSVQLVTLSEHSDMITIVGDGTGESNLVRPNSVLTNGPLTIENINVHITAESCFLRTSGYELVIGKNVTSTIAEGISAAFNVQMGVSNGNTQHVVGSVSSPVKTLYIGSFYNTAAHTTEGADLEVNDTTIEILNLRADGYNSSTQKGTVFTENVNITLNNATIGTVSNTGSYASTYQKAVQIVNNGGSIGTITGVNPEGGLWVMNGEAGDNTLSITETDGVFAVNGTKRALAVDASGASYVSVDGTLTVPAGTYTVTYRDSIPYTSDKKVVTFHEDNVTVDLAELEHSKIENKLFIGWTLEDGTVPTEFTFNNGDVLTAKYVDFVTDDLLYVVGAQIRKEGVQGLRFVVEKADSINTLLPNVSSYGSVILPSYYVGKSELYLDTNYTYEGATYTSIDVPAEVIYQENEDSVWYTVVVTDLTEEYYDRMFTVRGYVKYTDLNGYEKVVYSNYYATNNVNVAEAILDDEEYVSTLGEEDKAYYQNIVDTVKATIAAEFEGKTLVADDNAEGENNSFKRVYQLGDTALQIREVEIYPDDYVEGETEREPVTIAQTSDIHFNYVNQQDFEENNPALMATYRGRTWLKNAASLPQAMLSLRYSYTADAMVISGDIYDYVSRGAIELTNKYIFDVYPKVMAALGNHDDTRACQQDVSTPDPVPWADTMNLIQENWVHNIYYASKLVGDRVLMIQMDNGTSSKFWDSQVPLFKADLASARENGWTVLIFYHIPLVTGNPDETAVPQLTPTDRSDKSGNRDFTSNGSGIKETASTATSQIFELMRNNGDIIKGLFCGHTHSAYYSEFIAKAPQFDAEGNITGYTDTVIPQYTMTATAYKGNATKITVY